MPENNNDKHKEVNDILKSVFKPESLKELYDRRLEELQIVPTNVLEITGIQYRTLKGILEGTQATVDFISLIKLANFLQLPKEHVIKLHLDSLEKNNPVQNVVTPEKIKFIKENFDLAVMKKDGFIKSITDFEHIEKKIVSRLGLKSIFEYKRPGIDVAFSSGSAYKPKNHLTRSFWIAAAKACFQEIDNPYEYDRQKLIEFFPKIRLHSTDEKHGLINIIRELYKFGVTIIFQPPMHTLQVRGATFSVNDKPCIVLTNYVGFYSTLWWGLLHELFHVLFDWEEIKANAYHLSDDSNDQTTVKEKEAEANQFGRDYLLSNDKLQYIRPYLNNFSRVQEFAMDNQVHPSIIYVFNAYDTGDRDRMAWPRARRQSPDIKECTKAIDIPWNDDTPIDVVFKKRKTELYN